jgi:hypothetical protein
MDLPKRAYDIEMLTRPVDRAHGNDHGWCFGLPPGILPQQWPLDSNSGYPLMHGFTLSLPDDYRAHGPEIVALSFFAMAPDQDEGGVAGLAEVVESEVPEPSDPDLVPFWRARRAQHPRLFRMRDDLDGAFALILLTQQEFDGPLCEPPPIVDSRLLEETPRPAWLGHGSAAALWERTYSIHSTLPPEEYHLYKLLGGVPSRDFGFNRALRWKARAEDPNAGKPPRESWANEETGYQSHFYYDGENKYHEHEWIKDHARNHIGGTMRPIQNIPPFSPFYVEFGEEFGGYNFGGGKAQLDFRDMKFDWACG